MFQAKYPGRCADCELPFPSGTTVEYTTDKQLVIVEPHGCGSRSSLDEIGHKPDGVCENCFMVHNGECL